jgi:hypothetical protein
MLTSQMFLIISKRISNIQIKARSSLIDRIPMTQMTINNLIQGTRFSNTHKKFLKCNKVCKNRIIISYQILKKAVSTKTISNKK